MGRTMEPAVDPCGLLRAQLDELLRERYRLLWSKEVVYNITTNEFEYSAIIPPVLDELIDYTRKEIADYERGVRNSRIQRTANSKV